MSLSSVSITRCEDYQEEKVRRAIYHLLGFLGMKGENPLASIINPGERVILKPNWIRESHQQDPEEWESVITHPVVIKVVLELVLSALRGDGRIIITDAPQTDSSFVKILERMKAEEWIKMGKEKGIEVEVLDLREEEWVSKGEIIVERRKLPGDPRGSVIVNLGAKSTFYGQSIPPLGYFGADYKSRETTWAHSEGRNLCKVSRTVIEGDVFINLPKLKTHKKAGITGCMKNLVGINTYKNYLPHHSEGTPEQGGDQFPSNSLKNRMEQKIMAKLKNLWAQYPSIARFFIPVKAVGRGIFGDTSEVIRSGNWYGNDTVWRMIIDLNGILLYAEPDGTLREGGLSQAKRYLAIVDGIIAGEGNGPMVPDPVAAGLMVAGFNPVAVDTVCAILMGFDYRKIPVVARAWEVQGYPLVDFGPEAVSCVSNVPEWNGSLHHLERAPHLGFKPHFGWRGHIEREAHTNALAT